MNLFVKQRNIKRLLVNTLAKISVFTIITLGQPAVAQSTPDYRSSIEASLGGYYLKSPNGSAVSTGSLTISYAYSISSRYQAGVAYQNVLAGAGALGSSVSGFDLFGQYCWFNCIAEKKDASGVAAAHEVGLWGLASGLGLAQRSFQLSTQSVGFAGPYFKSTIYYFLQKNIKVLSTVQYCYLANGENRLSFATVSVGMGVDW